VAQSETNPEQRQRRLLATGRAFATTGEIAKAAGCFREAEEFLSAEFQAPSQRFSLDQANLRSHCMALTRIARTWLGVGDKGNAERCCKEAEALLSRMQGEVSLLAADVAALQAELGRFRDARQTARACTLPEHKLQVCREIMRAALWQQNPRVAKGLEAATIFR
jgi:ATP/maltotriose-dependent transcriptional regulator MalT